MSEQEKHTRGMCKALGLPDWATEVAVRDAQARQYREWVGERVAPAAKDPHEEHRRLVEQCYRARERKRVAQWKREIGRRGGGQ